jgi:hypothetical protein
MTHSRKYFCYASLVIRPTLVALCLLSASPPAEGSVILSDYRVTSNEILRNECSFAELKVWQTLKRGAVESTRTRCWVADVASINLNPLLMESAFLLAFAFGQTPRRVAASSIPTIWDRSRGCEFLLFTKSDFSPPATRVLSWHRDLKLRSPPAVPPDELLKPPRPSQSFRLEP